MESSMIPVFDTEVWEEDLQSVEKCLRSGWISTAGSFVDQFEKELGKVIGCENIVATVNGTAALHLALRVAGVQEGDLVLLPTLTFIASANAVRYCQAEPVFVDIDPKTFNLDLQAFADVVQDLRSQGKKPKFLLIVNYLGYCAPMNEVLEFCQKENIILIEDAAQSLGSRFQNQSLGTFGVISATSFNGNKIVTAAGGGAVISKSPESAQQVRFLARQARKSEGDYIHSEIGYNYAMPSLNASLGLSQLLRLEDIIHRKTQIHQIYDRAFQDFQAIRLVKPLRGTRANHWMNVVCFDLAQIRRSLPEIQSRLRESGVMTQRIYRPVHMQEIYSTGKLSPSLKGAEKVYECSLGLPSSSSLNREDQQTVIEAIQNLLE